MKWIQEKLTSSEVNSRKTTQILVANYKIEAKKFKKGLFITTSLEDSWYIPKPSISVAIKDTVSVSVSLSLSLSLSHTHTHTHTTDNKRYKLYYIKRKNLRMSKGTITECKMQPTEWEKIFTNHIFNMVLISRIYK